MEHLEGEPVVRVEIDGKVVLEEKIEAGAYVFEAPMDAVSDRINKIHKISDSQNNPDNPVNPVKKISSDTYPRKAQVSSYAVYVDGECVREGMVVRSPQRDMGVAGYVDTRMGTAHSRWMLAPGPWMPFSMVKLSPDNEGKPGRGLWQGGYDPTVESVGCFSHIHEWTMAGLGTMPTTGSLKMKMGEGSELVGHQDGYRSCIDKASETCKVGYYAVKLSDYGILAELTATERCGFQRYTYPAGAVPRVMIDLLTPVEYPYSIVACEICQTGPRRIEGFSKQETPGDGGGT